MTIATIARGSWLLPCAFVGLLAWASVPGAWAADDDPRVWLEKMNHALATRNYDGTFMHIGEGGRIETMRIVHRVEGGQVTERLASMDGSGREFVRNNDELTCYLPDKKTILVESRQERGPFLGSLPQFGVGVNEFYQIDSLPGTRILGRPVRVISVNPKDTFRFGYRLWLDEKTAMPLRTQLCDAHGNVIEQIAFARLDMPDSIPAADLAPAAPTDGMRWVHQMPRRIASTDMANYRATQLPPGFRLTVAGAQTLGGTSAPATHLVYSDGLATVSVFVESSNEERAASTPPPVPMQGLTRVGSGFVFSTVVEGHQVTAVGEVPAQTVEFIAHSVKAYGVGREAGTSESAQH
jgi:sigma-E factor negative regulatory protein RseB